MKSFKLQAVPGQAVPGMAREELIVGGRLCSERQMEITGARSPTLGDREGEDGWPRTHPHGDQAQAAKQKED